MRCSECETDRPDVETIPTYYGARVCRTRYGPCATLAAKRFDAEGWPAPIMGAPCCCSSDGSAKSVEVDSEPGSVLSRGHEPGSFALRRRFARHREVPTEYAETGDTLAASLADIGRDTERVYLTGRRPVDHRGSLLGWARLPEGWGHDDAGHYLDLDAPIFRVRDSAGRRVEVHRAASWFGDRAGPARCRAAAVELAGIISRRFTGAAVLATPATAGRELAVRSLPPGDWPVLSDEVQQLIRATSGQGRIEVVSDGDSVPAIHEYDGRMMYAALCWGLGGGGVVHDEQSHWEAQARGRYRITFTVPKGWDHVGLLPVKEGEAGWHYPASGRWETWADGAELLMASRAGWSFTIHERIVHRDSTADPLGKWAQRMIAARDDATMPEVRRAIRAMVLFGIGAMHGRPSVVTRVSSPDAVPPTASISRLDGDLVIWTEGEQAKWSAMSHPEWTSAIWARARARLMSAPGGVGALGLDRTEVIGFRTDAIYTARRVPEWDDADDGRPGRYRHVQEIAGPLPAPTSNAELLAAKRAALA